MARHRSPFGRLVATLLAVALPAMMAAMPLEAAHMGGAPRSHSGHPAKAPMGPMPAHGGSCCDLCGVACGACAAAYAPPPRILLSTRIVPYLPPPAVVHVDPPAPARLRLLPFPLGPPALPG